MIFKEATKTLFEIWEGVGDEPDALFDTVDLDRDSRRYIHVRVKNVIHNH